MLTLLRNEYLYLLGILLVVEDVVKDVLVRPDFVEFLALDLKRLARDRKYVDLIIVKGQNNSDNTLIYFAECIK